MVPCSEYTITDNVSEVDFPKESDTVTYKSYSSAKSGLKGASQMAIESSGSWFANTPTFPLEEK
jgi:hypothetical protein